MPHAYTLVVLTLLQLSRAEIPNAPPEWYAANLIKDTGYQPKPITEIFTLSSKNPIIVASTASNSEQGDVFSTRPTSTTSTTTAESSPPAEDSTQRVIPLQENRPTSSQPLGTPGQRVNETAQSQRDNSFTPSQRSNGPTFSLDDMTPRQMLNPTPQGETRQSSSQPVDIPRRNDQPPPQSESRPSFSQQFDTPRQMLNPTPQGENRQSSFQSVDIPRRNDQPPPQSEGRPSFSQQFDTPRQMLNPTPQGENRQSSFQPVDIPRRNDQLPPQSESRPSFSQQFDTPRQANQPSLRQQTRPLSSSPLDITRQMGQPPPQPENRPSSFNTYDNLSSSAQPIDLPKQIYQPPPQHIQVLVAQPQIQRSPQIQTKQVPAAPIPPSPPAPPVPMLPPPQIPLQPVSQQPTTGQPNYILIYQQAPLSIQHYPKSASQSRQSSPSTTQAIQEQTPVTKEIQTPSSHMTTNEPRHTRHGEFGFSSTLPPFVTTWHGPSTAPGVPYSNPPISSTIPPNALYIPCSNVSIERNAKTAAKPALPLQRQGLSGLTIRVTAPRGSVTNIKINPSTTTKKPSTHRSQRRKGNNYSNCVESCRGKKEPLCAAPLAVVPIDPNSLKGFPSICHLACHNSFRKNQPFEKIMDGRCSKLRTRIRTFDKNKLKREELNKAQYTVLNNIPETIVQVIQNDRSGLY